MSKYGTVPHRRVVFWPPLIWFCCGWLFFHAMCLCVCVGAMKSNVMSQKCFFWPYFNRNSCDESTLNTSLEPFPRKKLPGHDLVDLLPKCPKILSRCRCWFGPEKKTHKPFPPWWGPGWVNTMVSKKHHHNFVRVWDLWGCWTTKHQVWTSTDI